MFKTEFTPFGQVLFVVGALVVAIVLICVAADSVQPRRVMHKSDRLMISCVAYAAGACDRVKIRIQNKEAGNEEGR